MDKIQHSRPALKLREPGAIYTETVPQSSGGVLIGVVPFLKVNIINEPENPFPPSVARDIRASISFYDVQSNHHLLTIDGRWADSDQPSNFNPLASKVHLLATDFGIGQWHPFDIAYIHGSGHCYAWNNDNYNL